MVEDKGHFEGGWNWLWFGRSWPTAARLPLIAVPRVYTPPPLPLPYPTSPCSRIWRAEVDFADKHLTLSFFQQHCTFSLLGPHLCMLTFSSFVSSPLDLDISIRQISRGGWNWRSRWQFAAGPSSVWPSSLFTWCWTASSTIPPGDRAPGTFRGWVGDFFMKSLCPGLHFLLCGSVWMAPFIKAFGGEGFSAKQVYS